MPIVVRELVVRASVDEANSKNDCSTPVENQAATDTDDSQTENLLSVCMEKVMESIELKKER